MKNNNAVILLALAQLLVWAGLYYVFPALLVRWEQSLGWSRADLTAAITLAVFVSAFVSPVAGWLIDSGRGPLMMAGSTVLGGLCMFALAHVIELTHFYVMWALIGIALSGCLYEPCFALITRARGASAKRAIILVTLIAGFASSISFPVAHSLAEAFGWRITVQAFAGVVLLLASPLMWAGARAMEISGAAARTERIHKPPLQRAFVSTPVFWLLALGFGFGAVLHGVTLHHLLPILYDRGIHPDVAVTAASFIGPMQVAGRLAMMAAEKHISNHGIAIACFLVMGSSIALLTGAASTPALLVGFVILFGGGYGMLSIIRPLIAHEVLGEKNFGAKSGALAVFYLAGTASAPYLGSLIWGVGGYALVLPCLIVLAVVGLALYLIARRLSGRISPV